MIFDLDRLPPSTRYKLLASVVTPRPIAWVTSIDENEVINVAPFSFFNIFGSNPPLIAFAPGNKDAETPKDTARNIRRHGEFVIHMVDEALAQAMVDTAATLPHGQSELEGLGLTITPSEKITVPRITEAPIAMECTEHSVIEIGRNRLILGIVHMIHAREGFFDNNHHLETGIYHPIGRMASPDWYTRTGDQLEIPRPD